MKQYISEWDKAKSHTASSRRILEEEGLTEVEVSQILSMSDPASEHFETRGISMRFGTPNLPDHFIMRWERKKE